MANCVKEQVYTNYFILIISTIIYALIACSNALESIPIISDFAQEKEFQRFIVQEEERVSVNLNEYFRGNFLQFNLSSNDSISLSDQLISSGVISIAPPVQEIINLKLRDPTSPISQIYTELLYINSEQDQYFIYINEWLTFVVLDITYFYHDSKIANVTNANAGSYNIYNNAYLSSQRVCSHLVHLEYRPSFALFCLSNLANRNTTLVIVDLNDITKPVISYYYQAIPYTLIRNSYLRVLSADEFSIEIISIQNKSCSSFQVYSVDSQLFTVTTIADISSITYPSRNSVNYITTNSLRISDIKELSHLGQDIMLISDFNQGIFISRINCTQLSCVLSTFSLLQFERIDNMELTNIGHNQLQQVIATVSSPPTLIEIDIQDLYNPYVQRMMSLRSDGNQYISLSVIDSNEQFMVIQMLRLEDFRPVIRVYERRGPFKSFGIAQIEYVGEYTQGHYVKFLSFNHFILKTSEEFKIIKIQRAQLVVDTRIGIIQLDKLYLFRLGVSNLNRDRMSIDIEAIFLPSIFENQIILTSMATKQYLNSSNLIVYYSCGLFKLSDTNSVFPLLNLDNLFSGSSNSIFTLQSLNQANPSVRGINDNFFMANNPSLISNPVLINNFNFTDCKTNELIYFQNGDYYDIQLACASSLSYRIFFIDVIDDKNATVDDTNAFQRDLGFVLVPKIYIIDTERSQIFTFTYEMRQDMNSSLLWFDSFQVYNALAWMKDELIPAQYIELLSGYQLGKSQPVAYNQDNSMGLIRFESLDGSRIQLIAFQIGELYIERSFVLLAQTVIQNDASISTVIDMKVCTKMQYWLLFSNGTIVEFHLVEKHRYDQEPNVIAFRYLFKMKLTAQLSISQPVYSISTGINKVIAFTGQNQIMVLNLDENDIEILSNITLPLNLIKSRQQNFERILQFAMNSENQVVYAQKGSQLFVLFNDTFDAGVYYLIVYDISTWRHNSILIEMTQLDSRFAIDRTNIKIHLHSTHDVFDKGQVVIIIQTTLQILKYRVNLHPKIDIAYQQAMILDDICLAQQDDEIQLNYFLYPNGAEDQQVHIKVVAANRGHIVKQTTDEKEIDTITITQQIDTFQHKEITYDTAVVVKKYFSGFNMLQVNR